MPLQKRTERVENGAAESKRGDDEDNDEFEGAWATKVVH